MNEEPTWWSTAELFVHKTANRGDNQTPLKLRLLFEFFRQNAMQYAVLRVSMSDGRAALEGTYSHDELFSSYGHRRSSEELSAKFRANIETAEGSLLSVTAESCFPHDIKLVVLGDGEVTDVVIPVKAAISAEKFVNRVMLYLTDVNLRLRSEELCMCKEVTQRDKLQADVEARMRSKINEDQKIINGLRLLMNEKRLHWA